MIEKKPFNAFELKREKFENGLLLIANKVKDTETVAIGGSVKSGAICDVEGKFGAAELVARLLSRGTKNRSALEISQLIEESGATLSFDNRDETVSFSARCYYQVLKTVLETIGDCLMNPIFPANEIAQSRNEILAEIKSQQDDTRAVAYRLLMSLIYGKDSPYGRDPLGKPEDLSGLTREDLMEFHERNYDPSRVVIAISGRYDYDDVKKELERVLPSSKSRKSIPPFDFREPEPMPAQMQTSVMGHKSQIDLAFGSRAVSRKSPEFYSLNLGNLVLGRLGLYGRLGKNVREGKGVAYYSFSALQARLFSGHIGIFAGVNPKNVEKASDGISEEIQRITNEEISSQELQTAKRNLIGSLSISLDTSSERVGILHDIEYFDLGLDYLERYPEIIDGISQEDVLRNFATRFSPEEISVVAAGPVDASKIRRPKDFLRTRQV